MSTQLIKEAFVATFLLFGVVMLVSFIPFKFEFVKPIKQEFEDFDIYDMFYKGKDKENAGIRDTNIIIIQAAFDRAAIANQIKQIQSLNPSVIGIDLSFAGPKEQPGDTLLIQTLTDGNRVVNGYTIAEEPAEASLIVERFIPHNYLIEHGGYLNFSHADSTSVIRNYAPFHRHGEHEYMAFATSVVKSFSEEKLKILKDRNNKTEFINYFGNLDNFLNYSEAAFEELFRKKQLAHFKNKIVILGFFSPNGTTARTMEDMRFSPLNEKPNGKSFPDIYGVVIHANIIHMILSESYIHSSSAWLSYLISFCISLVFIYYIIYVYKKYTHPSHLRFFLVQLLSILLIVYLCLKLFDWFSVRIHLLPVILSIVLSLEMFDLYKKTALILHKKVGYKTIFNHE